MKQTLIAVVICALFASCAGGGDPTVTLQKKVDSLTELVSGKGSGSTLKTKKGRALFSRSVLPFSNGGPIDTFLTPWGYSGWSAARWSKFLQDEKYRAKVLNASPSAYFVLPASNLQYLTDSTGMQFVVVYMTIDTTDRFSLMYIGANPGPDYPQNDTIYEQPIIGANGGQYLLNHAWPCPQCAVENGLNTHQAN